MISFKKPLENELMRILRKIVKKEVKHMSLRIPQEINGEYFRTLGKAPYTYQWSETEEFIITKCRQRIMEKKSEEQLTPRER